MIFIGSTYHEASHTGQYAKLGTGWCTDFVRAELNEVIQYPTGTYNPYGKSDDSNAPP